MMTERYCETIFNINNHLTFGGIIYKYDYEEYTSISDIANRIYSDQKFDKNCEKKGMRKDI